MPFNPALPANNSPIVSAELRNQFNGLKDLIDAIPAGPPVGVVPIGGVAARLKSFPNTPALLNAFVERNGQVLNDVASPFHGATISDLNGTPRFLHAQTRDIRREKSHDRCKESA